MARRDDEYEVNPYAAPESDLTPDAYESEGGFAEYASFWKRFVAWVVDTFLTYILGWVLRITFAAIAANSDLDPLGLQIVLGVLGIIVGWLYYALQESSEAQATLGKKSMGLRVTDELGERISFGRATGRHFAKILSAMTFLIGYLMQPFTAKKQALHDMIAGTLVVKD